MSTRSGGLFSSCYANTKAEQDFSSVLPCQHHHGASTTSLFCRQYLSLWCKPSIAPASLSSMSTTRGFRHP